MVNKNGERELAYIVKVDGKERIEGYDRIVSYQIGGWKCVAGINDFEVGDLAVYIEIDSMCPYTNVFSFLDKGVDEFTGKTRPDRHRIKTQRFAKGKALSQGLLMPLSACHFDSDKKLGDFVTEDLGITYYEAEDNSRKETLSKHIANKVEKELDRWAKKHKHLSKIKLVVSCKRKMLFKKYTPKNTPKKNNYPYWVVKTDEERVQNCSYMFNKETRKNYPLHWVATEKIDGTSTTFTMRQEKKVRVKDGAFKHHYEREFLVCSRNVVFDKPDKKSFYDDTDGNVYLEMAEKYNIEIVLNNILDANPNFEFITIQGETYGGNIQKRNYGEEHRLAVFNVIYKEVDKNPVRLNPIQMKEFLEHYPYAILEVEGDGVFHHKPQYLPIVPIVHKRFVLRSTCDKLLSCADGSSKIDGGMREGLVFRSFDGVHSFKAVSNAFLEKYHS